MMRSRRDVLRLTWAAGMAGVAGACTSRSRTAVTPSPGPASSASPTAKMSPTAAAAHGVFEPLPQLAVPRSLHTASLLKDGRVVIAGGNAQNSASVSPVTASVEVFDAAKGIFSAVAPLLEARQTHAALTLADGRVLVSGGVSGDRQATVLRSAEIYDPSAGTWKSAGAMLAARAGHALALLPDGRALAIGGFGATAAPQSTEIFDLTSGGFVVGPAMLSPHGQPRVVTLPGGAVLVVGDGTAERLNPGAAAFEPASDAADLPALPLLLDDGSVLLTGGVDRARTPTPAPGAQDSFAPASSAAVVLDPVSGKVRPVGPMVEARLLHEALRLADGRMLIAGGAPEVHFTELIASAEIFDPGRGTFSKTGDMAAGRVWFSMTLLATGGALVVGANSEPGAHSADLYVP